MRFATCSFAVTAVLAGAALSADDLTIISKRTSGGGPPTTVTSYVSSDHVRMSPADGQDMILDFKAGTMTSIDARKKQYFVVTRQDMEQLNAKMQQQLNSPEMQKAQSQAQQQMKNMPPEMQKMMQQAMGGIADSVSVQKAGGTRKIAGYTCENWTISMGTLSKTEQCLSTELPLPTQTWDMYRDFAQNMSGALSAGPMAKSMAQLRDKMKDMKGLPLATTTTINVMGRTQTSSTEVTEVKRGTIPASAWEIPAGYAKVENPMAKALAGK